MSEMTLVLKDQPEISALAAAYRHSACYRFTTAGFVPIKNHLYS